LPVSRFFRVEGKSSNYKKQGALITMRILTVGNKALEKGHAVAGGTHTFARWRGGIKRIIKVVRNPYGSAENLHNGWWGFFLRGT